MFRAASGGSGGSGFTRAGAAADTWETMTEYRIFITDAGADDATSALWPVADVRAESPELALAEVCADWEPCRVLAVPVEAITALGWRTAEPGGRRVR